jgi:hypothetical protein
MEIIVGDNIFKTPKKILAIGTGESVIEFVKTKQKIPEDYIKFGMHRALPYLLENSSIRLDYWTWGDPDAILEGLSLYEKYSPHELPTIIIPDLLLNSEISKKWSKLTKVATDKKYGELYDSLIDMAYSLNKLEVIPNSIYAFQEGSTPRYMKDPSIRFNRSSTIFGSFTKAHENFQKYFVSENKFTSIMLPICHYLGAAEVYNLGFDNKGNRIDGKYPMKLGRDVPSLELFKKWKVDWAPYHKMEIFSVIPDKFTNINTVLGFKEL